MMDSPDAPRGETQSLCWSGSNPARAGGLEFQKEAEPKVARAQLGCAIVHASAQSRGPQRRYDREGFGNKPWPAYADDVRFIRESSER